MNKRIIASVVSMLVAFGSLCSLAHASPYENRFEKVAATYQFQIDTTLHSVTRTQFTRPVFLFANSLRKIRSEALVTNLSMTIHWTDAIALQFTMPLITRLVLAEFSPVQISEGQTLASQSRNYSGFGPGDPTLSIAWLMWERETWNLYTQLGTRVPLDDNPGSSTLPTRIPNSSGQNAIFASLGTNVSISSLKLHLQYQGHYLPGNAATYLIHQAVNQTWLTGSLSPSHKHHVHGTFTAKPHENITIQIRPGWIVTKLPKLVTRGQLVEDTNVEFLEDLYVEGAFTWHFSKRYAFKIWYRSTIIDSVDVNPFFPIDMPVAGGGLSFTATRW